MAAYYRIARWYPAVRPPAGDNCEYIGLGLGRGGEWDGKWWKSVLGGCDSTGLDSDRKIVTGSRANWQSSTSSSRQGQVIPLVTLAVAVSQCTV